MVKALWNGKVIAESSRTEVVEGNHYFPMEDVRKEFLEPSSHKLSLLAREIYYRNLRRRRKVGDKANVPIRIRPRKRSNIPPQLLFTLNRRSTPKEQLLNCVRQLQLSRDGRSRWLEPLSTLSTLTFVLTIN